MKPGLFTILCACVCCFGAQSLTGQVYPNKIIGQCKAGNHILAQLAYDVTGTDTIYTFSIRNRWNGETEDKPCSISFPGSNGVVNQLYTTIKQLIFMRNKKRRDYATTIALSDKLVVLATSRVLGTTSVVIYLPQGSNTLTEWQVDKVFGK